MCNTLGNTKEKLSKCFKSIEALLQLTLSNQYCLENSEHDSYEIKPLMNSHN